MCMKYFESILKDFKGPVEVTLSLGLTVKSRKNIFRRIHVRVRERVICLTLNVI